LFDMKRFLDLADFSREEIADLVALAGRLEKHPEPTALAGKILGLVFFNPSLRTLSSFQVGMMRLGGSSFVITPGQGTWQLETRLGAVMNGAAAEHVREGIPVLASYADALGIRAFRHVLHVLSDHLVAQGLLHGLAPEVVLVRPAGVPDGAHVHEADLERLASLRSARCEHQYCAHRQDRHPPNSTHRSLL